MAPQTPSSAPRRRRWLWWLISLLILLPIVLAGALVVARAPLIRKVGERALARVAERLQQPVRAEVEPLGWWGVRLSALEVGPAGDPLITVDEIDVTVDPEALKARRLQVASLVIRRPQVQAAGGDPRRFAQALRTRFQPLAEQASQARPKLSGPAADDRPWFDWRSGLKTLPPMEVVDARLVDTEGGVDARVPSARVALSGPDLGAFEARVTLAEPALGACDAVGDLTEVALRCDQPVRQALPGGLEVAADRLVLVRAPSPHVRISAVRIQSASEAGLPRWAAPLAGAEVSAVAALLPDALGGRPFEVRLDLAGGTFVSARGRLVERTLVLEASAENVDLPALFPAQAGLLEGSARLALSLPRLRGVERAPLQARLDFEMDVRDVLLEQAALAEAPVGPFSAGISGAVDLEVTPGEGRPEISLRVDLPRMALGEVVAEGVAAVDTTGEAPHLFAEMDTGRFDVAHLARSLPEGLMPRMGAMKVRGPMRVSGRLDLDVSAPEDMVFDIGLRTQRVEVVGLPRGMKLDRLRHKFRTRFELPDGERISREVGPETKRWVPLEEMAPLLPIAVMAQEDGGFFKHGGVSMLHLRGSLARNLKEGRFVRGGSTLTMQLARNLYLNHRKTLSRKLEEVVIAWLLERNFKKEELLALYLNVVEFGPDVFGIKEAAKYYFDKTPAQLEPVEVVFIVRLLPGPRLYHEQFVRKRLSKGFQRSIARLLKLLVDRGHLDAEEAVPAAEVVLWAND